MAQVMFYVQHLLGIGHVRRAALLARGMVERGIDVCVVLGGREVPEMSFEGCARVLLPPVHAADATFKLLLDDDGNPIDDAWRDHRATRLMFEYQSLRPDVLMIELFPFGRRMFGFELLPLLSAARAERRRPHILCSLRDILVGMENKERDRKTIACARACFDHVLVHGDPQLVPIEASFPPMAAIADMLVYTGYVADRPNGGGPAPSPAGAGEVIVSGGGGAVGLSLLRAALAARPLSRLADRPWRLITGPNLAEETFAELAWAPPPGVIVERWRADLPALLAACSLSVSQAGYNTVCDILRAGCRSVLVPFAAGGETEQPVRAARLAALGLARVVPEDTVSGDGLAAAVEAALAAPPPPSNTLDLEGARRTAEILRALA